MSAPYQRRWENRRKRDRKRNTETSYYGLPVIHRAHWRWSIIFYFFLGGIAAGTSVIATFARIFGGKEGQHIARAGTYVSFLTFLACPVLLIWDLGRPARFLNMLRIVKFRSPMSLGTWSIVIFGGFCSLAAVVQAIEDGLLHGPRWLTNALGRAPSSAIGVLNIVPGFFVAGYTGVLLAVTAVPLWTKRHLLIGPLFLSSAISTAAAAISLVLVRSGTLGALERMERLERFALVIEATLLAAFVRSVGTTTSRPLRQGTVGRFFRVMVLGNGITVPGVLHLVQLASRHRSMTICTSISILTLVGGFFLRLVFVFGGHQSADDPAATFELTSKREDSSV